MDYSTECVISETDINPSVNNKTENTMILYSQLGLALNPSHNNDFEGLLSPEIDLVVLSGMPQALWTLNQSIIKELQS